MSLTICMVVYNEEKNLSLIEHNLCLLSRVNPQIQCLLIDNASDDGSNTALMRLTSKYGARYILRLENHLPQARQQALVTSQTQWVGFIDADCRIDEKWIQQVEPGLSTSTELVAGFGGPWTIIGDAAPLYQGLFKTFLGHFGHCYLLAHPESLIVEHLPTANIVYHREKVLSVGGFSSPHAHVGEDLDLSHRIQAGQLLLEYKPNLKIQHQLPVALTDWCSKMFLYGTARGEVSLRYKTFSSYKSVLPLLFLLTFLLSFVISKILFLGLVAVYLVFCMHCSFERQRADLFLPIAIRMVATHVFYAMGVCFGYSRQMQFVLKKKLAQWRYKGPAWEDSAV